MITPQKYFQLAGQIWRTQVPARGQASTVAGELIRVIEKLRDEATRNGNGNWQSDHRMMVQFLQSTFTGDRAPNFETRALEQLHLDIAAAGDGDHPPGDDVYERLTHRAVDWDLAQGEPVPRAIDPALGM